MIRVANPGTSRPFTIYDETTGEFSGFEIDLWKKIAEKSGYDLEFVRLENPATFAELDLNRVDTVAKQISITPARQEKYDFTQPFFFSPYCLTVREDNEEIKTWEDMSGKSIALAEGSAKMCIRDSNAGGGDGFEVYHQTNGYATKSIKLAQCIEARVVASGQKSRGVKTRLNGSGTDYFGWCRQVKAPAVLCEGFFVDNLADSNDYNTAAKQQAFGRAYAWGVLDYLGIAVKQQTDKPADKLPDNPLPYTDVYKRQVQCWAASSMDC